MIEESKSVVDDLDKSKFSNVSQNISKFNVLEKIVQPTLTELLEDEIVDKFGKQNIENQLHKKKQERQAYNRNKADLELARSSLKKDFILK